MIVHYSSRPSDEVEAKSMTKNSIEARPNRYARHGGALYLFIIALGIFSQVFVRDKVIVAGDAVATASNLTSMETLWRAGIATEVLMAIATVMLAMVYYYLLRPVQDIINELFCLSQKRSFCRSFPLGISFYRHYKCAVNKAFR
jgi:hypothetical protein